MGEVSSKSPPRLDFSEWLGDVSIHQEPNGPLRLGRKKIGKKNPWGVNFTHGSRSSRWRDQGMELEELEEEPIMGELDQEDWMMKQAIKFLQGAFDNLKAGEALA